MSGDCDFNWRPAGEVKIPFGYVRVHGQSVKGDGIWDGTRFVRVKKGYPFSGMNEVVIIRRCVVEQEEIKIVLAGSPTDESPVKVVPPCRDWETIALNQAGEGE
jgi:hypothetical protein